MITNKKIDQALTRLTKWSEKPQWVDFLHDTYFNHLNFVFDELDLTEDDLFDYLESEAIRTMNSLIFEDFFTNYYGENGELNVINDYLKRRGSREPPVARQFLKALLESWVSVFEVIELDAKGRTMKVRDLLQEDMTLTIQKSSDMDNCVIWDCMGARVVSMNGKHYFTRGALRLSRGLSKEIVGSVHSIASEIERAIVNRARMSHKKPSVSRDILCAAAPIATMLTHAWVREMVSIAEMPLPEIHNMDNEKFTICEVRFPILGDLTDVIATLDEIEGFVRQEKETVWDWTESRRPAYRAANQRTGPPNSKKRSKSNESRFESIMLGFVELRSKALVLSVNSAERADRGKLLLESRLGNLVGQSLTSYQDLEQAMTDPAYSTNKDTPIVNEELSALQDSYLEEHYRRVLDEPVPMLGNKTPRKAATAKNGRSEVVEWLKGLENMEHRRAQFDGTEPFDSTWIWKELNIEVPR